MNILFFYRIYPNFGGVETVTTVLANKFASDGNQVTIVSIEQPHMELKSQLSDGIDVLKLGYPVFSTENVQKFHQILKERKIDILINQWGLPYKTTQLCNAAIRGLPCHLISVLHGSPYTSKVILTAQDKVSSAKNVFKKIFFKCILFAKELVIKKSIRYNIAHNEKYILLSKSFIQPLIQYSKVKQVDGITAIGNPITIPVDLTNFSLEKKKKQILYAGRMDFENKRVNRIISAWQQIALKYPDWELILVGDGPHKPTLIETVKKENIPRVTFYEFQETAPISFYKDASIYMLTSDLEGFGLVILESMSFGVVPVVYGSYEAVYDIIEDGKSGFITPKPYSETYTVQRIEKLIQDDQLRKKMAHYAMERATKFSLDSVVHQWYTLFKEL